MVSWATLYRPILKHEILPFSSAYKDPGIVATMFIRLIINGYHISVWALHHYWAVITALLTILRPFGFLGPLTVHLLAVEPFHSILYWRL